MGALFFLGRGGVIRVKIDNNLEPDRLAGPKVLDPLLILLKAEALPVMPQTQRGGEFQLSRK